MAVQENVIINFEVNYEQLENAQAELAKTGKIDTKGFQAIQSAIDTTATDTKGLIKTFKEVATASTKMGKTVEDAFGAGIQDALDEAGVSVDEFAAALKKANAPATSLKKELAQLKEGMARMKAEGKDTGKEFDALRQRAGKLSDAIADANAEIKNAGSDTKGIDNVIGSISALAGGYAAAQGAIALFGEESEDLQKALLKVNGAMALATGIQQAYNATLKEGSLRKLADVVSTNAQSAAASIRNFVLNGSVKVAQKSTESTILNADSIKTLSASLSTVTSSQKLYESATKSAAITTSVSTVATGIKTAATKLYTFATTGATIATRVFRAALVATGIGAIIVLIATLVSEMSSYGDETKEAKKAQDQLRDSVELMNESLDFQISRLKRLSEVRIAQLESEGKTGGVILKERIKLINEEIALLVQKEANSRKLAAAEKTGSEEAQALYKQANDFFYQQEALKSQIKIITFNEDKKRNDEARKRQEELDKKRLEALKKALKDAEDQQRIADANAIEAALNRVNKEIEAERIKYDNFEDMRAEEAARKKKDAEDWDRLWKEFQESLVKSSENAAAKMKAAAAEQKRLEAERIKQVNNYIEVVTRMSGILNLISQQKTENDRMEIESERNKLNEQLKAGAISQKQFNIRQKQLENAERAARQRQAEREKQAAVFQAVLAIPKAFLQGLSQGGIYLAAVYAALAAAEAAIIISKPVPKFFRGKKDKYEGPGVVADMGAELVERDGRMYLYTKPTQTYLGANDKVYTAQETRNIMHNTNINTTVRQPQQPAFDYDRLGKAIPRDSITINVDKDYISEAVASGLSKNNYFTNRYQFRK